MAYGRKSIPPPSTPFEEFMANASERMIAAKLQFVEALRELPPAAWIAIGVVILVLAASSLNLRGKKEAPVEPAATTNAAVADVAAQCVVINALSSLFPDDGFVAEESAGRAEEIKAEFIAKHYVAVSLEKCTLASDGAIPR